MRAALLIARNDFLLFLRNRSSLVWLVVMPLTFVYFMGLANRGPGGPATLKPALLLQNRDRGFLGDQFLQDLGSQGLHLVQPTDPEASQIHRGLRLAPDFTEAVLAGRSSTVRYFEQPGGKEAESRLAEIRIARALIELNSLLLQHATRHPGVPPTAEALDDLRRQPGRVLLQSRFAGRKPIPTGFNLSLPGVLVMYLLMNLLTFGGAAVAGERRGGVLRRLGTLPISRGALIGGKITGLMFVATLQTLLLLTAGRYLFGVNLGDHLAGILLTLLVYSWVAAALGVLIGSVVRAEDKVVGLCVLLSMVMSALGGCWWPLELGPPAARTAAHLIPTGWAMEALHRLITYGDGLPAALPAVGVLAAFGLLFHVAAVRSFRL